MASYPLTTTLSKFLSSAHGLPTSYEKTIEQSFGSIGQTGALKLFKADPDFDKFLPDAVKNPPLVGIEVEVENMKSLATGLTTVPFWAVKDDGTLRNYGVELTTPPLKNGEEIAAVLLSLHKTLEDKPNHDFSWRTSIHVHVSVLDYILDNFATFFLVYPTIEPLLFKVFADSRWNSVFCVPLVETKMGWDVVKSIMTAAAKTKNIEKEGTTFNLLHGLSSGWKPQTSKYTAANLSRVGDLGTIEFRHLGGTNNIGKLRAWISCLTRLIVFCRDNKFKDIYKVVNDLQSEKSCHSFLKEVLGNEWGMFEIPETKEFMLIGARRTVDILNGKLSKHMLKYSSEGGFAQLVKKVSDKKKKRVQQKYSSVF